MGFDLGIGEAALAVGAIGSAVSAVGALSSAQAQSNAASYQAQVAANNQAIAGQNAAYATQAGQEQATEEGLRNRAVAGAITTSLAANNMDVNSGSAADVRVSQRELSSLDTEQTVQNSALQAYGYRTQETNFGAEQQLQELTAANAKAAGPIAAAGDLLSGASSLGLKWSQLTSSGAITP